ncbi:cell division protein [uncultured Erythrobacter sp.]|uniref:cell division protein FtsX n=1 Tax=uncultured Erythrobacter sp. TaxID=263913 RepID=UPI0026351CD6|nr:cell division protein [uncultured Erythrobacter sp.]
MSAPPVPEEVGQELGLGPVKEVTTILAPPARLSGPIPWVIAILIALVVIAAAGGLSLRNLADNARADLADAVTVQIIEAGLDDRTAQTEAAATALGAHPLVTSVRVVPETELQALLEPWLGVSVASDNVPIPALIDVELSRSASTDELAQLQSALDTALEPLDGEARVDAQSQWLRPVYDALSALQYLALALITLVSIATASAVWLAARNAFINHRETVEIVHLLGGTDAQVTRIFERSVLREAAFGAVIGLLVGLAALWLLGQQFASLDSGMVSSGGLALTDWLIIAAIPVGGVMLALITGRITIGYALRSML